MKGIISSHSWLKVTLAVLLTLLLILIISKPFNVASESLYFINSDSFLYEEYLRNREKFPTLAVMYLWAYVQRDPPAYINNPDYKRSVTAEVQNLVNYIYEPTKQLNWVNSNLKSCGCFPCDKCQLKTSGNIGSQEYGLVEGSLPSEITPPPDAAVVCVDLYYGGRCELLSVGTYNNAEQIGLPNDSISSVLVGSKVKLTLYLHGGLTGDAIRFTSNDPDLTDNWIDATYRWNDNTTSLKVELR